MKKVITVLLSLVLSVSLVLSCVGCGNNETEEIQQGNLQIVDEAVDLIKKLK